MSAYVETHFLYRAVCPDCGWYGDETEHSELADHEQRTHDEEQHDVHY